MANPFDTLRGMLANEGARSYDNQTVRGGLDKFAPAFEQQAAKANFEQSIIAETVAWLRAYGGLTPEQRAEATKAFVPKFPAMPRPAAASPKPLQPVEPGRPRTEERLNQPQAEPRSQDRPERGPRPERRSDGRPDRDSRPERGVQDRSERPPREGRPQNRADRPTAGPDRVVDEPTSRFTQDIDAGPTLAQAADPPASLTTPGSIAPTPVRPAPPAERLDQAPPSRPARPIVRPTPQPRPPAPPGKRKALPPEPSGVGLDAPLTVLRGIGRVQAENLQRLNLRTMGDALYFFPRRYVDYSELKTINQLQYGEEVTVIAQVWEAYKKRIMGGRSTMVTCVLNDGSGAMAITWFNQPWLVNKLTVGRQVQVAGRVTAYMGRLTLGNAVLEDLDRESLHSARIVPIYPLTKDVKGNVLRTWMYEAVGYTAPQAKDPLPEAIRTRANLPPLSEALLQIHFPDSQEQLAAARRRLAFDEMFLLQLGVQRQKMEWRAETGQAFRISDETLNGLIAALPYTLTGAQQRAVIDLRTDMARAAPMNRLLQGDVGSGKTVVAALAMGIAVNAGAQAAIMAPTAILAEQHYRNISSLLSGPAQPVQAEAGAPEPPAPLFRADQVALLLGATPETEKQRIYDGLRDGSIKIAIGTQALIQEKVEFANLGLVVMDEQHRFGVAQRAKLRGKGLAGMPHVLVMTATPIPRTLALTVYGELDLSIIDELPPGRLPIETRILYINERERSYAFLRRQVEQGRQAYVICPLVEETDKVEAKAAVDEHKRLQAQVFPDLRLGLLHGRLSADEKEAVMTQFRAGEVQVLVSTSVVEVGVDVPNASTVLVEGANRFGLSQLHQFRGRVGRGAHQSYCLLASEYGVSDPNAIVANARLAVMEETQNGFVLAEKDLELRGPGEFLGTQQSGFGALKLAKLTDLPLIDAARREAVGLLEADAQLSRPEHAALAVQLSEFWRNIQGAGDVS